MGLSIKHPAIMKKGDYLKLKMLLPGYTSPCSVALAAVRWTKGSQFGVEFIKMTAHTQRQLHHVGHRANRALTHEGNAPQFAINPAQWCPALQTIITVTISQPHAVQCLQHSQSSTVSQSS